MLKRIGIRFLVACSILASSVIPVSCSKPAFTGPSQSITLAYSPFESTALLWVASDQQYFRENGLNVTLRKYDTGSASLGGVVNGEADLAVGVSEFPVVRRALQGENISVLVNADKGEFIYLVGRKDRGIDGASDLKGKRIGTALGTISEYYIGAFLELNGLSIDDVILVDLKTPQEWVSAAISGEVDAVVIAQPDANAVKERLGANGLIWPVQGGQFLSGLVVSTDDWLASHPELAMRFISAMARAEQYVENNPQKAKAMVEDGLSLDPGYMETVWKQNQFSLSLDQSLIFAMEDEARWLISSNLTSARTVPNFLNLIAANSLEKVRPGSVRISGK